MSSGNKTRTANDQLLGRRQFLIYGGQAAILAGLGFAGYRSGWWSGRSDRTSEQGLHTERFAAMGTYLDLSIEGSADPEAIRRAVSAVSEIERTLSYFDIDSDLSHFNRKAGREAHTGSPHLLSVLDASRAAHRATGGAFDPTVTPLLAAWGIHHAVIADIPSSGALRAARERVGLDKLTSDGDRMSFAREGMSLDLGGIAKGHAVDQAALALKAGGLVGIVNAGGDIRVAGGCAGGEPWRIGVRDPLHTDRVFAALDLAADRAVATSGTYEQFVEIKGRRVPHIVDPRSGEPGDAVVSATVMATTAMAADAMATACVVMSPTEALTVLTRSPGFEGLLVWRTEGGLHRIEATPGMPATILHSV